jgi:hypothetical protein
MKQKKLIREDMFLKPLRILFDKITYKMHIDVKVNDRRIDVVFVRKKRLEINAVEMKVKNWRRALEQAAVYQLFTSHVYVALWHKHWNKELLNYFKKYGIGVILIKPVNKLSYKAYKILNPKRKISVNTHYAKFLRDSIGCNLNGHKKPK